MSKNKRIKIQVSGGMASGKTTVSEYILSTYENTVQISFAQPIYQIIDLWVAQHHDLWYFKKELSSFLLDFFGYNENELKTEATDKLIDLLVHNYQDTNWSFKDTKHRKLLQEVGDVLRSVKSSCIIDYLVKHSDDLISEGKSVVCDDARYPKEIESLSHGGFLSIRLNIDKELQIERIKEKYHDKNLDEILERLNHPTEVALNNYSNFDYIIDASLPLDKVTSLVDEIIAQKQASWIEECTSLFPKQRNFTKEESEDYDKSLDKLYKPTGRNLFDL